MKKLEEIVKLAPGLHGKSLPKLSKTINSILVENDNYTEISKYGIGVLTQKQLAEGIAKLKCAFPTLPKEFFATLIDRVNDHNFTDSRFMDSINYVIDNCIYPTPTVANFLSYDEKVKLYTYEQYQKLVHENSNASKFYKACIVKFTTAPMWAHISDIQKYKLTVKNKL